MLSFGAYFEAKNWPAEGSEAMSFTEYVVALGGMLAPLGAAGLVAAGLIRWKARH